ncbi:MAG TPA: BglII/BstYI family type II restriction endonuclease [Gemmataceae bacterium]|nr:BglII/BstYI family type II restriction endonuclease [Gemmataceae bacterium]
MLLRFKEHKAKEGPGMGTNLLPADILERFHIEERRHACAILASDFPPEFSDIMECLRQFRLLRSEVSAYGGRKTDVAGRFDNYLRGRGWAEKSTSVSMTVDGEVRTIETHKVDLWKNQIALEVEWNNKDPFFSRDLNAFRLLHELGIISVGVIITRADELQGLFDSLGWAYDSKNARWRSIGKKYGASTTHWGKLLPRVDAGGAGSCPLLLIAIRRDCYEDDLEGLPIVTSAPTGRRGPQKGKKWIDEIRRRTGALDIE